jgi:hypothetical protein
MGVAHLPYRNGRATSAHSTQVLVFAKKKPNSAIQLVQRRFVGKVTKAAVRDVMSGAGSRPMESALPR